MKAGVYIGPIPELKGQRALLQDGFSKSQIRAQFNDMDLRDPRTGELLGFHWHAFPATDFEVDKDAEA